MIQKVWKRKFKLKILRMKKLIQLRKNIKIFIILLLKEDPIVSFEKGRNALKLAIEILKIIEN